VSVYQQEGSRQAASFWKSEIAGRPSAKIAAIIFQIPVSDHRL
jgi:hypothetical protein